MKKREDGFFKSTWTTLIAPILVGIVLSYLAGRLVIQITGFQLTNLLQHTIFGILRTDFTFSFEDWVVTDYGRVFQR